MKTIAIISLLTLVLFSTGGYYVIYSLDLLAIRHEVEEIMEGGDRPVVFLSFPVAADGNISTAVRFTDDDDEFIYEGKMYDVISCKKSGSMICYKCYADKKETALNQELSSRIEREKEEPAQKNKGKNIFKKITQDIKTEQLYKGKIIPRLLVIFPVFKNIQVGTKIFVKLHSPPPEAC